MKKIVKAPRVTLKQKFEAYRSAASSYIYRLQNPMRQLAFSVKGYEVTPTGKKANALSAPEMLAIVGTAAKLGKNVQITSSGSEDGGQLNVYFVDQPEIVPAEMQGY